MLLYVIDIDGFEMKAEKKRIKSDVRRGDGETGRNLYGRFRCCFFFGERRAAAAAAANPAAAKWEFCVRWKKPKMSYD